MTQPPKGTGGRRRPPRETARQRRVGERLQKRIATGEWREGLAYRGFLLHRERLERVCGKSQWGEGGVSYREIRHVLDLDLGDDQTVLEREVAVERLAETLVDGWKVFPKELETLREAIEQAASVNGSTKHEVKLEAARIGVIEAAADMRTRTEVRLDREWLRWTDDTDPLDLLRDLEGAVAFAAYWTLSMKRAKAYLLNTYLRPDEDDPLEIEREDMRRVSFPVDSGQRDEAGSDRGDRGPRLHSELAELHGVLSTSSEDDELRRICMSEEFGVGWEQAHRREREVVFSLLALGGDAEAVKDVAAILGIAPSTVRVHKSNFLKRTKATG